MIFEWDENKNQTNKAKHGIDFETASTIISDHLAVSRPDGDGRWQTMGHSENRLLLLFVAHTWQEADDIIVRIISAREVTPHERRHYENGTF